MPRKKKTEEVQVTCFDIEAEKKAKVEVWKAPEAKPVDYGSGMTRVNNMLAAGFSLEEIREVKRNE